MRLKLVPLLALFLLGFALAAPSVTKDVGGTSLLDFGDKLNVNLSFSGEGLVTLRDPIPEEFSLLTAPALCTYSVGELVCDLKGVELERISYTLVAVSMGERIIFERAMLDYTDGAVTSTTVSNDIETIYQVGYPRINTTSTVLTINGEKKGLEVFPNSEIGLLVGLKNVGATEAKTIKAEIEHPSDWAITGAKTVRFGSIKPGESVTASYSFKAPDISKLEAGQVSLQLQLSWYDNLKNNTIEGTEQFTLTQVKPDVRIQRTLSFEWKKEGELLDMNGTLEPFVHITYTVENLGNAKAYLSIEQELPQLSGLSGDWGVPLQVEVEPEGKITRSISGKTDEATVVVPAARATVQDEVGNDYPEFSFDSENVEIGSTLWSTLFVMTKQYFPKLQLASLIIFFLLAGYVWKAKGFLRLAVIATLLLCVALLYSTYTVLF